MAKNRVRPTSKAKSSPATATRKQKLKKRLKEESQIMENRIFNRVGPDVCFVLAGGKPISSLPELALELEFMIDEIFFHHVTDSKNDFANWIKHVIKDDELAERIWNLHTRPEMQVEILKHLVKKFAG